MKYADKINCKYIIIIGDDEVNNNIITLKNMVDGSQLELNKTELVNIKNIIGG